MKYDFNTTEKRSILMRKIKSNNTTPELLLRKKLWSKGFRYRIHVKSLPGKPDIVFKTKKVAIFIDGEFWHGKDWDFKKDRIRNNKEYWIPKIERNIKRDLINTNFLKDSGWKVLRFWQNEIVNQIDNCIETIVISLNN